MTSLTCVAAQPGGNLLAVSRSDGWLGVWLPMDNRIVQAHALRSFINKIGWTCDAAYLIATAEDSLAVFTADGRERVTSIATRHGSVRVFATHPTRPIVATTGSDGIVRLWDVATGEQRGEVMARQGEGSGGGTALALSEDTIVVGYESGYFATCDHEGKHVGFAQLFAGSIASFARVLPAGRSFLAGGSRGKLVLLSIDTESFRVDETWNDPPRPIAANTIEFAPDGRFVVAASDGSAYFYKHTRDRVADHLGTPFWLEQPNPGWDQSRIVSAACFVPRMTKAKLQPKKTTHVIATSHFTGCVKLWNQKLSTRALAEVRFENDQPIWTRDGAQVDALGSWLALD